MVISEHFSGDVEALEVKALGFCIVSESLVEHAQIIERSSHLDMVISEHLSFDLEALEVEALSFCIVPEIIEERAQSI